MKTKNRKRHTSYKLLPTHSSDEIDALRASIALQGVVVPIVLDEAGNILDGYARKKIADSLGYECPSITETGLDEEEKRLLVRCLNLARRHLSQEQKRKVISDQLVETPNRSNRWLAKRLGVSHCTVGAVRKALQGRGEIDQVERVVGEDGKQYRATGGQFGHLSAGAIVGHNTELRNPFDFYQTPAAAVQALLDREKFKGTTLDPCQGSGTIPNAFKKRGYDICGTDIRRGEDFLESDRMATNIVCNPPYSLASEFVEMAKSKARSKIAMLLKLDFLHGVSRYDLFRDEQFPLKVVHVFSKRIRFGEYSDDAGNSRPVLSNAWFVWEKRCQGKPTIEWIRPDES